MSYIAIEIHDRTMLVFSPDEKGAEFLLFREDQLIHLDTCECSSEEVLNEALANHFETSLNEILKKKKLMQFGGNGIIHPKIASGYLDPKTLLAMKGSEGVYSRLSIDALRLFAKNPTDEIIEIPELGLHCWLSEKQPETGAALADRSNQNLLIRALTKKCEVNFKNSEQLISFSPEKLRIAEWTEKFLEELNVRKIQKVFLTGWEAQPCFQAHLMELMKNRIWENPTNSPFSHTVACRYLTQKK